MVSLVNPVYTSPDLFATSRVFVPYAFTPHAPITLQLEEHIEPSWDIESLTAVTVDSLRLSWELPGELSQPLPGFYRHASREGQKNALLWRENKRAVYGSHATYRSGVFNFRLRRYCAKNLRLSVWFSLPKWKHGHNAFPATGEDLMAALEEVNRLFHRWNLPMQARQGQVVECHLNRNVFVSILSGDLMEVLSELRLKWSRPSQSREYKTSTTSGTKSYACNLYDKIQQLQNPLLGGKGEKMLSNCQRKHNDQAAKVLQKAMQGDGPMAESERPMTCLRVEVRLQNARIVRKKLGVSTVEELLLNYSRLGSWFGQTVARDLFCLESPSHGQAQAHDGAAQGHSKAKKANFRGKHGFKRKQEIQGEKMDSRGGKGESKMNSRGENLDSKEPEGGAKWRKEVANCLPEHCSPQHYSPQQLREWIRRAHQQGTRRQQMARLLHLRAVVGRHPFELLLKEVCSTKFQYHRRLKALQKERQNLPLADGTCWFERYTELKNAVLKNVVSGDGEREGSEESKGGEESKLVPLAYQHATSQNAVDQLKALKSSPRFYFPKVQITRVQIKGHKGLESHSPGRGSRLGTRPRMGAKTLRWRRHSVALRVRAPRLVLSLKNRGEALRDEILSEPYLSNLLEYCALPWPFGGSGEPQKSMAIDVCALLFPAKKEFLRRNRPQSRPPPSDKAFTMIGHSRCPISGGRVGKIKPNFNEMSFIKEMSRLLLSV